MTAPNVAARSAGTICRPAAARGYSAERFYTDERGTLYRAPRPRIRADRDFAGRWLVEHQGHCYPFPSYPSAVKAALEPRVLCRFACICPVRGRETA